MPSLIGVDEAGRGALAGPVVAAAVCLPEGLSCELFADSKQLTASKRDEAYAYLIENRVPMGVGIVNHIVIDRINILRATLLAMKRAVASLGDVGVLDVLVDGNRAPDLPGYRVETLVKGDQLNSVVSAASIVAKVTRDRIMTRLDCAFPEYGFASHKGYGTVVHYNSIEQFGLSKIHRVTFYHGIQARLF